MKEFRENTNWPLAARAAATMMILMGSAWVARAQTPPYALFQYSSLTGSGNTISATQVPVTAASGVTMYVNLSIQFDVDSSGNLTLSPGFPQISPSPSLIVSSFTAGRYTGPGTIYSGGAIVNISGPGVTDGGATQWSSAAAASANQCTYPGTATWYVGPIANSPYVTRLKSAGITSTAWSYGVSTSPSGCNTNNWGTSTLIGVSQIGNTITFVSFTNGGKDSNLPFDQITYTLAP